MAGPWDGIPGASIAAAFVLARRNFRHGSGQRNGLADGRRPYDCRVTGRAAPGGEALSLFLAVRKDRSHGQAAMSKNALPIVLRA